MSDTTKKSSDAEMTFFEHIDALRPHLLRAGVAILILMVAAFILKEFIVDTVLLGPQSADFPTNRIMCLIAQKSGMEILCINQHSFNMVNTTMAGQFNLHLKISIITAIALAIPYILWEIWQFVKPALTRTERKASRMFVLYVSLCFFGGLLFGYYLITPLTVNFLTNYSASPMITNMIDINSYLSTVIGVSLACAAVFQLPLLVYFLARMGLISAAFMKEYRKHAIIVLAILSAIITPPDVFSLILVALPLYGLYEFSISLATKVERKMAQQTSQE